jgi:hypothetical protein
MSEVSNSAAGLSLFGSNPLLVETRKTQARASRPVRTAPAQAPSVILVRKVHQSNRAEDRTWAILALAALALVVMSVWA